MAEFVLCVASAVAGCLVAPVNRHCGYVISYDSHVRKLKAKVAELANTRQEMQDSINDARNNVKPIKPRVNEWMKDVDAEEARRALDDDRGANKTCFYGWLPNLKVRYLFGREARRKAERIQSLIDQKPSGEVYDDPAPGRVDGTSDVISSAGDRGDTNFDSRASILEDIMNALDHEKHKVVGVYGPGGVGKTTLLEEVEKKLRKEGRPFNMIVKAKVSQTPDLNDIQYQIADDLNLNLKDKQSQQGRRDLLFQRLQKDPNEKVLIILDDLWKEFDLKEVGIPSGDESRGCKLLLTSRFKDVLEQMKCDTPIFHLTGLKDDEAFELFEKTVGDKLKDDEDLKAIAHQVVNKLAGLPLLIISVASTLKHSNVHTWRTMLIKIEEPNVETIVKLSYDHLKSEDAKTLFLLCGLIGGTIQVETLLGLGMGLGLFEKFRRTMQDSRDRLNTILDELRSACLLLDGGDDKNNVTIHDLYSEAVVSTPFRGQNSLMMNSNYDLWQKEKLEKCWAICLADVGRDRLTELMTYQFLDLKILMLSQPNYWRRVHPCQHDTADCSVLSDFESMKELQVLYVRFIHIARLPSSIGILGNLHSLYLDHCDLEDVAILGKLKALQILCLARSALSRLPKEIGDLTNLRLLNLRDCNRLRTIEPGVLKRLINLEELYLRGSFDQWMGKDGIPSESCNARLAELKSLTKIASLEISIPDPYVLLEDDDFPFGNLNRFWINIGNAKQQFKGELRTMILKLEERDSILLEEWVQKILQKTQYLHLEGLKEFKKNAHELCTQGFGELKRLYIDSSPSIKYIANSSDGLPLTAFTILEHLFLKNLVDLEKICNGPVAQECFGILKAVTIEQCHRLENLWFLSQMQSLVHLQVLKVCKCDSMQAIITDGAGEIEVRADDTVELPNLRSLNLRALPKMTSFRTGAEGAPIQVSLPCLESLGMVGLLGLEKILSSEPSLKYNNLKSLFIMESKSTSSILKDWILKLPNLESMEIVNSLSTEVFDLGELKVTRNAKILSRLTNLRLFGLPKLQCMWKQDVQLQGISIFRNLEKINVNKTGLSFLFPVSVAKCLREIREIEVNDCPNMMAVVMDEEGRDDGIDDIIEFPLLKQLRIRNCPAEKFFSYPHGKKKSVTTNSDSQDANSSSFFDQKVTVPNITTLRLEGLRCKELWNKKIPAYSFLKLESLGLRDCNNLQCVAPSHMWKRLQRCLKDLKVVSCYSIEIIYEGHRMDIEGGELRWLYLRDLKNLRHIWQSNGLPNILFPNLREVEVEGCSRLETLFPTFTAKFLRQIEELVVKSCENMELIADHEKGEEGICTTITFSKLTLLGLFELPKFRSFLPEKYSLKFPCSKDLEHFPSLQVWSIESCGAELNQVNVDWENHYFERLRRKLPRYQSPRLQWWLPH